MGASFSNASFRVAGYIPQFDGLRGLSILAVFAAHSEFLKALPHAQLAEYGRVGVDLFFVNVVGAVAQVSAAFLIASVSWRLLETPLLRLKSYFAVSHVQDGRTQSG